MNHLDSCKIQKRNMWSWSGLKCLLITVAFTWIGISLFAQNENLSGQVMDENGKALSDVRISAKNNGTISGQSDKEGRFSLNVATGSTLVFAKNGYLTTEIKATNGMRVTMKSARKITASGKVTDASNHPMPGVTVIIDGTNSGTTTNANGEFKISVNESSILRFSFIGYQEQQVRATSGMKITMEEDQTQVEEVVVIAYGAQSKVSVTGAISSISTEELKQSPAANLTSSLAGRLPGLTTIQSSGQPGAENFEIYLRGASTSNGTEPLILIDGVPQDDFSSIDPNEIANVSILKDASSTAVFGVRGANGVILITTKQGTKEKTRVNITAECGIQDFPYEIHQVDSWEFATLRNQALKNDGAFPEYSERQIGLFKDGSMPYVYPNTDWWDLIMKPVAPQQRYNINVSGGTDRVNYFVNAGYLNQGGMFNTEPKSELGYDPQYKLNRYNFRTNLQIKATDWIKVSLNLGGYIDQVNACGGVTTQYRGNPLHIFAGIYQLPPTLPGPETVAEMGVPANEVITTLSSQHSPWGILNRNGYERTDRSKLLSSLALDFNLNKITKGLSTKVMASFDGYSVAANSAIKDHNRYVFSVTEIENPDGTYTDRVDITPRDEPQIYPLSLKKSTSYEYKVNLQWIINYNRTFKNKHAVTGMILAQRDNREIASGSSDLLLPYNVLGIAARATYGYNNRYLAEFNAGYNGSEQFAKGNRFGFFPAVSVGWVLSNEKFMKKQHVISHLKLRASYGIVGNDKLGNTRFLYLDNVVVNTGGFSNSLGEGKYAAETLIGNPDISWETAYKQNYGLELVLFKKLTLNVDYFRENRRDILLNPGTVPTLGGLPVANIPKANLGHVLNRGFEIEMAFRHRFRNGLQINLNGNFNYNKNTVKYFDEAAYNEDYAYRYRRTGYSLSQTWGYLIDWNSPGHGYFTSQEEIDAYYPYVEGTAPRPGDFVYVDVNGDKKIDSKDYAPIKYGQVPRITYGATIQLNFKGFDLSCLFQGVAQTSQYYSGWGVFESQGVGTFFPHHRNAWTKERYESGQKIDYPALASATSASMTQNTYFIMDRSYLRLKNAEIGYVIPQKYTRKVGMERVRIYANGQNLLTWDHLPFDHIDPEQKNTTSIPILRLINFGVNVVF